jgi:hypothetical protein
VVLNENYFTQATYISKHKSKLWLFMVVEWQTSYHLPQSQLQFNGSLIPTAPADMFMALGKTIKKYTSFLAKKMVVIRMGDVANTDNPTFFII